MEKNIKDECIYVRITGSLCCTAEINIVNQLYFNLTNPPKTKNICLPGHAGRIGESVGRSLTLALDRPFWG